MRFAVGAQTVFVEEDPPLPGRGMMGLYKDSTIYVDPALSRKAKDMAVLHELLHAASDQYSLGLTEAKVRVLEQVLTQAAASSPEFFRSWVESAGDDR
jgi:hypothetical protein